MCPAFATGLVRVTRRFLIFAYTATARIALVYLAGVLLVLMGTDLPFLHGAGTRGGLWLGFILHLASLNLPLPRMVDRTAALYSCRSTWALAAQVTLARRYVSVVRLLANRRR